MSNAFLNAVEYANVMLLLAKNQLVTGRLVDGRYKSEVTDENGLATRIKRPPRFARNDETANSSALATQDILTGYVDVAVDNYAKVHIAVGDIEYVQSYNELMRNKTMMSAAQTLAHQIDNRLQQQVLKFNSWVAGASTGGINASDPSKVIASPVQFNSVHTRLMNNGVPNASLSATVLFDDGELIRGSLIGGNIQDVNRTALERIKIPILSEIDLYATQQVPSLTTGSRLQGNGSSTGAQINNGTLSVNYRDVRQGSAYKQTLTIDTLTGSATIKKGEVLTISGVYAWDWRNNAQLDYLQQFTVVADATMSGGAGTIDVTPPLIVQGTSDGVDTNGNTAFATVNAAAVDGAYIKFAGAASTVFRVRAAWHKAAIALVSAKLQTPFTGESSFAQDPETGISIRYWRGSDINTGAHIHRWDAIFGTAVTDCFMGARICGT